MTYQLVKLEEYTSDALLQETLKLFASGGIDLPTAQAAAWHLADKMTWDELRAKQVDRLGGLDPLPFFSEGELRAADELIAQARANAKESSGGAEKRVKERAETAAR